MSYNKRVLLDAVHAILKKKPRTELAEICAQLTVERHCVTEALRRGLGMSFREYQRRLLIVQAVELLKESELSMKQIAFQLGYQSPASFARFIKSSTGRTPSQWRD